MIAIILSLISGAALAAPIVFLTMRVRQHIDHLHARIDQLCDQLTEESNNRAEDDLALEYNQRQIADHVGMELITTTVH